jgi:uncharacterized membrane protein
MRDNSDVRRNGQSEPRGTSENNATGPFGINQAPSIVLPKGGGAIRGIGEKFATNPVTGTGSMTVPIATSPGRSGFGPQLSLSYDSGSGNGPFGFGWSLSLPAITRKTDKGLPQYRDAEESDVYILSGAEDLVPVLQPDGTRFKDDTTAPGYIIHRYRPRIEGLFARIERWTNIVTGEIHWRSITRDNVTTLYGKDTNSRIFDPTDPSLAHPTRVFSWLICQSYDDKGNATVYEHAAENDDNVDRAQANERNRVRTANRYLKRIKYGNRTPNRDATTWHATDPAQLPTDTWMFEVVFDYGEGHYTEDAPDAQGRIFARAQIDPLAGSHWPVRQDPFSTYRAGFEVRTCRLCRRVLMFHHFPQELGINDCLVRSTEFSYSESPIASFITGVTQSGYVRQPAQNQPNRYLKKSLPPLEFEYSQVPSPEQLALQPIRELDAQSVANLPVGLDGASYQWMDLDGEGTSGILTEQADGWYYKRNLSANNQVREDGHERTVARLGPTELVASKPAVGLAGGAQFLDLAGDGQVDLVQMEGFVRGFYERTDDAGWAPFQPFVSWPDLNTRDPDLRFVDLTGDGHADILITEGEVLTWYLSLAEEGFGPAVRVSLPLDEEKGPRLVFADGTQSVYLADLSGDGLSDLVRIRNGEVCYWPNLGYGHFGAKVTMDNAPWFDSLDQFDQRRIRLADTDGSGTTDILYLWRDGVQIYFNQSGNRWSDAVALPQFPPSDNISSVQALDLLGDGTACLVWSSPLPGAARRPMRYLALMQEKPHLLVGVKNNLGAETKVHYAPSTKFYLDDKRDGKPWVTRLPFPVHVVEQVETFDYVSRNRFVTRYVYHHGFYDGIEREFRGFGMVEQFDSEEYSYNFSTIDVPGATSTVLFSINDTGQIDNTGEIVGAQRDVNGVFHSVLTDTSASSFSTFDPDLPAPSQETSFALGINGKGEIVGAVSRNDIPNPESRAYSRRDSTFILYDHPNADPSKGTEFHGVNDAGARVGIYTDNAGTLHGFIQDDNTTTLLESSPNMPANKGTWLFDINNLGQRVGGYFDALRNIQHGLFTDGTTFITIDFPGSDTTWLNGINDLGQMVGAYFDDSAQVFRGFLTDGKNFITIDYPNLPPGFGTFITGIDNSGRIVGYYGAEVGLEGVLGRGAAVHGFLATPVSGGAGLGVGQGQPFSPPTRTKTWFHTGAYVGEGRISEHFEEEYYHEGDTSEALLLDDTILPTTLWLPDGIRVPYDLTSDERREAARALKGSILRQEIYALDGTDAANRPYSASERNYTIEVLQPQGSNRHAVCFVHARETIDFHYERKLFKVSGGSLVDPNNPPADAKDAADPRVTHALTLEVDDYGNVLKAASIGYGRRFDESDPALLPQDRDKQRLIYITLTENLVTNSIDDSDKYPDDYRTPLPAETRTYELRKPEQEKSTTGSTQLYRVDDLLGYVSQAGDGNHDIADEDLEFAKARQAAASDPEESNKYFRRIVERVRTLYRPNDMGAAVGDPEALLPLGQLESLALPGSSYKLAFTPGLLSQVYQRGSENLLPVPADILGGMGPDRGGFVDLDGDGYWWIPSGRVFRSPTPNDLSASELAFARAHFFLPHRYRDPFHTTSVSTESLVTYDGYNLLVSETRDPLGNRVTVGERDPAGNLAAQGNDYRVLQPALVTDPNDNGAAVSFDALGLVVGTAVMGKTTENLGDSLDTFAPDLSVDDISGFFSADDPHAPAPSLLGTATTRIIYDVDRFKTTRDANPTDPSKWEPVFAATLARETHSKDPVPQGGLKIQISFSYSDGFGREIQKKIQAESGPVVEGGPIVDPRWVGSGWTIFNNKGKPVRQYEPFFSQLPTKGHQFEFGVAVGVSPILCYDPVERVVATIHPNHTYEKVVFDPWRQESWDVNDTVTIDPKADSDAGSFFVLLPDGDYLPTWYDQRIGGALGSEEQGAANKAAAHAGTPSVAHFDTLGRTFLTVAHNRVVCPGHDLDGSEDSFATRVELDIEGNQRAVRDERKLPVNGLPQGAPEQRIVMRYDYDMLGNRIHQASMEAGERWMLNDVTGKPIRSWDSRGHAFRTEYDALRRPIKASVQSADP